MPRPRVRRNADKGLPNRPLRGVLHGVPLERCLAARGAKIVRLALIDRSPGRPIRGDHHPAHWVLLHGGPISSDLRESCGVPTEVMRRGCPTAPQDTAPALPG